MKYRFFPFYLVLFFSFSSCSEKETNSREKDSVSSQENTLFTKISSGESKIRFKNIIREDLEFNFLNYPYLYTGAGVAIGDFDNDGFEDMYFTSNFGANKLYRNNGDFTFEDVTVASKTEVFNSFCTGATCLDINNDGWLDIYVSRAGSLNDDDGRRNLLFVNQKDGTFNEEAKQWGIDDPGYSTQVFSLDYDHDGDLDLYVLNYRYDFKNNTTISSAIQRDIEETTSDQLYRNDGSSFTKVTGEANIYNKAWGLAGTVGDFNNDGWDDIYISNDYLEPDMMYINQRDGTFRNEIKGRMNHISFNSMGADYADLDNDLYPDLITVDMLAENYARSKENMASMSTANFMNMVSVGYHHAYMANMLHYNVGNGKFKETSQLSGIVKTDWSWTPLIADFDNDGLKDVFISNGVYKDYTNQDFRSALRAKNERGEEMTLEAVLDMIPSQPLDNYMYKNNGDMTFSKVIKEWGMANDPGFSNGAAYADFDNDGDLDLVVNNVNSEISLYRNNARADFVKVKLNGPETNRLGLGSSVFVESSESVQFQEKYITRGFQSSVSEILIFGLGQASGSVKVTVEWPDGKTSALNNVAVNETVTLDYSSAVSEAHAYKKENSFKREKSSSDLGIKYTHQENDVDDYEIQLLLPQKQSTKGTGIVKADVNGDGLDDFFVGNAKDAKAALYIQSEKGIFTPSNQKLWSSEAKYEDANALFFDADGDGDQDLYVVSAGYELAENDQLLRDRLYINDSRGRFSKSKSALPSMLVSGKSITAGDYDNDGDLDLFVGGNVIPGRYPLSPRSYLLRNDNGKFTDVSSDNSDLTEIGMISEAIFTDYDSDDDLDIIAVGEWMSPIILTNNNGFYSKNERVSGLESTEGWWYSISAADFDGDGDQDYVLGNIGKNNKFQPKKDKPIYIYAKDFDDNGSFDVALSKMNDGRIVPIRGKECSSEQNPYLLETIGSFKEFASLDMEAIYGEERLKDAKKLTARMFESAYVENLGGGAFKLKILPNQVQTGPTLSFITRDFDDDGNMDILGIGAIYDAEVETIRYDSNYGYVLLGDGKGEFKYSKEYDPFIDSDAKDITEIKIDGRTHYMVVSNNEDLEIFTFSK